jgi:hypothetical protein
MQAKTLQAKYIALVNQQVHKKLLPMLFDFELKVAPPCSRRRLSPATQTRLTALGALHNLVVVGGEPACALLAKADR